MCWWAPTACARRCGRSTCPEIAAAVCGLRGLARPARRACGRAGRSRQELFDAFSFYLPPGEQFLGYPVAGPGNDLRPGHRSWNVVWYRPADETADLPRLLTDATGHTHELSIPPPLIAPGVVAEMRAAAERLLPPQFRAAMALIRAAVPAAGLRPGERGAGVRPGCAGGRRRLRHPAACRRRRGQGGRGCGGAGRLPRRRPDGGGRSLAPTRHARLPVGRRFVAQARRLGCYLRYRFDSEEEQARAAASAAPERVLAETATLDFMRQG